MPITLNPQSRCKADGDTALNCPPFVTKFFYCVQCATCGGILPTAWMPLWVGAPKWDYETVNI